MHSSPFPIFPGFSAEASLSLSTDGPIAPELWAAAREIDRQQAPLPRIGKITLKPAAVVAVMVQIILKEAARKACVTREDFLRHGLKHIDIDRHYDDALRQAALRQPGLIAADAEEAA